MIQVTRFNRVWFAGLISLVALASLIAPPALFAAEDDGETEDQVDVEVGVQGVDLDADQAGKAQFLKYQDYPDGAVLGHLLWNHTSKKNNFQFEAWNVAQRNQRFDLFGNYGTAWKVRAGYKQTPFTTGGGAVLPLQRGAGNEYGATFSVADFTQQAMEDPDGNGIPFYTDPAETAGDNALVFGMMNDVLAAQNQFLVGTDRNSGYAGFTYSPGRHWTLEIDASQDVRDGTLAMGSGTYQRITDVNGDGITDYDYFFSVRGLELPAPIDYRTTMLTGSLNYQARKWFVNARGMFSEFDGGYRGITYDNPFWFTDTVATSGSRRGLWESGRMSMPPSNEAWDFALSAGFDLPARTRITALASFGEMTQDDLFMPMTTSTALIGTADINGDGVIDAQDDPTDTTVFQNPFTLDGYRTLGPSLDATVNTQMLNLTITSKPVKKLKLLGRYRSYSYEGQEGIQAVSGRAEYVESQMKTDFKKDTILHTPLDYTRNTLDIEAAWGFSRAFKLRGFYKNLTYQFDQYKFDATETDATRDAGSRAVAETGEDTVGLTGIFGPGTWVTGYLTVSSARRDFDGDYRPGFDGENSDVRQFDIAKRDRDAVDLRVDFNPSGRWNGGLGFRAANNDFPDSIYGLQEGNLQGVDLSLGYFPGSKLSLFLYGDYSKWDGKTHIRTKCANCGAPDPALAPWNITGFDQFSDYTDTTSSVGVNLTYDSEKKDKIELTIDYTAGEIEQDTFNTTAPRELNPANPLFGEIAEVAVGHPFPNQENSLLDVRIKWTRMINKFVSAGIWYGYQDFSLTDFQLDGLQPYGANFLDVDDATRYLFLGNRISDYRAHIGQAFVRIVF